MVVELVPIACATALDESHDTLRESHDAARARVEH